MERKNLTIDREKRLMLLKWLSSGIIDGEQLHTLYIESTGDRTMTMEEARAFLRELEETY